jgi:hypothetical protein
MILMWGGGEIRQEGAAGCKMFTYHVCVCYVSEYGWF